MNRLAKPFLLILALLALTLALALPAAAGVNIWTSHGPDGGFVTALAADPTDPFVLYAGTRESGVFKSTDGGDTWSLAGRGLGNPFVSAVTVDPVRHQTVYVATLNAGLFKSTDGGATWTQVWEGVRPEPYLFASIYDLVVDPRRPGTLFAGTNTGFYRSTDGGVTWSRRGNLPAISTLAFDAPGGWLYAGTDLGVFRSFDQGKTWAPASDGLSRQNLRIESLAIDPERPQTLLAATFVGIYRSLDRGKSWQQTGPQPRNAQAIIFARRGRAYAATAGGLYRSTDAGATWRSAASLPFAFSFEALAVSPAGVFAGSTGSPDGGGLFRSLDAGITWERAENGLYGTSVRPIAADPSHPGTLFAVAGQVSLLKSTDRGATWTNPFPGAQRPLSTAISDILLDPARPGRVYMAVASHGPIQRSDDGGATWERLDGATVPMLADLALDPRTPDALWGAGSRLAASGLFHSADGGVTWEHISTIPANFYLLQRVEVDPRDPRIVYAGGAQVVGTRPVQLAPRLYRSTDGGQTWERRDTGLTTGAVRDIAVDTVDPSTVYVATEQLFRSTDAGLSWSVPASARGLAYVSVTAAPAGPGVPAAVYAARQFPPAVLRSTDRGATWTLLRRGLGAYSPQVIEVDPNDPAQLYLGTSNGGLMTYTLAGAQ